jgi:hypothetical protein
MTDERDFTIIPASFGDSRFQVDSANVIRLNRMPENRSILIGRLSVDGRVLFLRKQNLTYGPRSFTFSVPTELLGHYPGVKVVCIEIPEPDRTVRFCALASDALFSGIVIGDRKSIEASHQRYVFIPYALWKEVFNNEEIMDFYESALKEQESGQRIN